MSDQMGIFDVIYNCRAMRRIKPDPVPEETLVRLIDAANQAPSGSNQQNGRWIVVRDRGAPARIVEDGWVENVYRLQIMNTTESVQRYRIGAAGLVTHTGYRWRIIIININLNCACINIICIISNSPYYFCY